MSYIFMAVDTAVMQWCVAFVVLCHHVRSKVQQQQLQKKKEKILVTSVSFLSQVPSTCVLKPIHFDN